MANEQLGNPRLELEQLKIVRKQTYDDMSNLISCIEQDSIVNADDINNTTSHLQQMLQQQQELISHEAINHTNKVSSLSDLEKAITTWEDILNHKAEFIKLVNTVNKFTAIEGSIAIDSIRAIAQKDADILAATQTKPILNYKEAIDTFNIYNKIEDIVSSKSTLSPDNFALASEIHSKFGFEGYFAITNNKLNFGTPSENSEPVQIIAPSKKSNTHKAANKSDIPEIPANENKITEDTSGIENTASEDQTDSKKIQPLPALLPDDIDFGNINITYETYSAPYKKLTAKKFESDMNGWASTPDLTRTLLSILARRGGTTLNYIQYLLGKGCSLKNPKTSVELIASTLKFLEHKGYLFNIIMEKYGSCYIPSCKLMDSISILKKKLSIDKSSCGEASELTETSYPNMLASHLAASLIFEHTLSADDKSLYDIYSYTIYDNCFIIMFVHEIEGKHIPVDTIIGQFNSDELDNDFLRNKFDSFVDKNGSPKRIILASLTLEYADKLASNYANDADTILLYTLEDNKFFTYPDHVETSFAASGKSDDEPPTEPVTPEPPQKPKKSMSEEETMSLFDDVVDTPIDMPDETIDTEKNDIATVEETPPPTVAPITVSTPVEPVSPNVSIISNDVASCIDHACVMINSDYIYCATTYLKAQNNLDDVYRQLAYAVHDPMANCEYVSNKFYDIYANDYEFTPYLKVATSLRIFFYNNVSADFGIKSLYQDTISKLPFVDKFSTLRELLYTTMDFKSRHRKGLDAYADYRNKDKSQLEKDMAKLCKEAASYYDVITGPQKINAAFNRFIDMHKLMFDKENDLATYLQAVVNRDYDMIELAKDFIKNTFLHDNGEFSTDNINNEKMADFILIYWDKAQELATYKKKADLMGAFHQKIVNKVTNTLDILCQWIHLYDLMGNNNDNEGMYEYKTLRKNMMKNLRGSIDVLESTNLQNTYENAGQKVILFTLKQILARIDGSYLDGFNRYFYIDFLKSDKILLNDNFMPAMNRQYDMINGLSLIERIEQHISANHLTLHKRLHEIADGKEDYGTAKLICTYLDATGDSSHMSYDDIKPNIEYASKEARRKKEEFIDNLDYMESFGQIDNLSDKCNKDIIQSHIESAFEDADDTHNYGFFDNLLIAYQNYIMENARSIGNRLEKDYQALCKQYDESSDKKPEMYDRLMKIREALEAQEYTIAEDRITRWNQNEFDTYITPFDIDYLVDFEDNYAHYFQTGSNTNLRIQNRRKGVYKKDLKGGEMLADNWLNGNDNISEEQMTSLLKALEFEVESVKKEKKVKNTCIYTVKLKASTIGGPYNAKHSIAAFGSDAVEKDFRVITIIGNNDTANLLERRRDICNNSHTIAMLDWNMPLSERRNLARKIKEESSDKIFAVLDKVMMQYLIIKYNKDHMNKMLMALLMPFSYCQPYIYSAANTIPPEMFIGRKNELQSIESPTGAQLVYGGRQLGKSALLRMAQQHVNNNNGNRSLYIDIKGLDYTKAATKIGHELYDEKIIDKDQDQYTWEDIARLLKNRLRQTENPIPYLLLLLDEADTFIESSAAVKYAPFDQLKDVQSVGNQQFKFVIAGLHNIIRFKNDATGHNNVIIHLTPLTIYPFKATEARELLKVPLYYMGIRFPEERDILSTLILAESNYFPGLIQLYCAKLLESLKAQDYAGYDQVNTPPYTINKRHIQNVLNDETFRSQVRQKFEITLKLDEDDYYYIIALLLARLYCFNAGIQNFSPEDIKAEGDECGINRIAKLDVMVIKGYMEELVELNILRKDKTDGNLYSFNRYRFFQMMGTADEIDSKLTEYMEDSHE